MHPSKVLERIRSNESACGVTLHLHDASLFEMAASIGFDAIWLDLEHHSDDGVHASELLRGARAGGQTDVVVRPGKGEFARMARLLEVGAHGIMYPGCTSVSEAREVVRWAKFAPIGSRGFDGANVDSAFMNRSMLDYIEWANANTFVIIQIEDIESIELVEEIAHIRGVDMLMLGPADMSVRMGCPGQFDHPTIINAQARIAKAAAEAGKHWAVTTGSVEQARKMRDDGAGLVFHGADLVFIKNALLNTLSEFRKQSDHAIS
ncbi:HpcH/HpaI aldolase family protein [Aeoliella sp.]|uniref:HpcH/HpaI aldolase family protein n=1 Tax=Aeoliella sp. TaxID=2795800 RepID=UPI003CCB8CD9